MGRGAFIISNMQQAKTKERYSRETLLPINTLYDHIHHLTQADVDATNALVCHIERTRNPHIPKVGDRVRYTTRHGDFYGNALIETVREDGTRSICLCPYVPFVRATAGGISCAVSGGPFTVVAPHALHPTGSVLGDFCAWGHCGACGNGIVRFCAEVPLWEFREPEPLYGDFSTEKWRKISLHKVRDVGTVTFTVATAFRFGRRRSSDGFSPITKERYSRLPIRSRSSSGAIGTSRPPYRKRGGMRSMLPLQSGASTTRPNP